MSFTHWVYCLGWIFNYTDRQDLPIVCPLPLRTPLEIKAYVKIGLVRTCQCFYCRLKIVCFHNLFMINKFHFRPYPKPEHLYGQVRPAYIAADPSQITCSQEPAGCVKSRYRTLDGSCNNLRNPLLGVANTRYLNKIPNLKSDRLNITFLTGMGDFFHPNTEMVFRHQQFQ